MQELSNKDKMQMDIYDRLAIAQYFVSTGCLDRNNAIEKIMDARRKHIDINVEAKAEQSKSSVPLEQATNYELVNELLKQAEMLTLKLGRNAGGNQ